MESPTEDPTPYAGMTPNAIANRDAVFETMFTNHPPATPEIGEKFDAVTALFIQFAKDLDDLMPAQVGDTEYRQLWDQLHLTSMYAKKTMALFQWSY